MKPPKHTFPCDYLVKIVGENHENFPNEVLEIIQAEAILREHKVTMSQNNRFLSLSVTIYLEDEIILEKIYQKIKDKPYIKMIL